MILHLFMESPTGYADSGHKMAVEFDRKIIIYWWMTTNLTLLSSVIGIPLMIFCYHLDGLFIKNSMNICRLL